MKSKSSLILAHYVENWLGKARITLKKNKKEDAENFRPELIVKLERLDADATVRGCIEYLKETNFLGNENIDGFQRKYKELNPRAQQRNSVLE